MAKATNATAVISNLLLMLSLLPIFPMAESQIFPKAVKFLQPSSPTLVCDSAYGVKSGDTCFGVTQKLNLTTDVFDAFNPNLNCSTLFVGQWLCIDGTIQ